VSGVNLAVYAARLGDLLAEARTELESDAHGEFLVLAGIAVSKQVADRIEDNWSHQDGSDV
jgi:hypothetical protein